MLNVWHHLQDSTQIQEDWVCEEIPEEAEGEEATMPKRKKARFDFCSNPNESHLDTGPNPPKLFSRF